MRDFLRALWPKAAEGNLTLWFNPSRASLHAPLADALVMDDDDLAELHRRNQTDSVYFGAGLRVAGLGEQGRGSQGTKQDVIALPCFSLDVDFYHPIAHKATNLPTRDDVGEIFEADEPTIIVDSGFGWQAHYVFDEPWLLDSASARTQAQVAFEAFQRKFIDRAAKRGWHVDSTATIQRVWRLPGFINRKTDDGIVASMIFEGGPRYRVADLVPATKAGLGTTKKTSTTSTAPSAPASPSTPPAPTTAPADVVRALQRYQGGSRDVVALALAGESLADRGGRDAALHRVCSVLAFVSDLTHPVEALAEALRPSLQRWADEPDATKTIDEELAKACAKLTRARADRVAREEADQAQLDSLADFAAGLRANLIPYVAPPDVDVTGAALPPPGPAPAPPAGMPLKHTIIQVRSSFWIWDFTEGRYIGPKIKDEVLTAARDAWATGAAPAAVDLSYTDAKGVTKTKLFPQVMKEYGTVAADVLGRFALDASYYDTTTKVFVESIAPLRVTEPVFNPQIDQWLRLLAGDDHYEKLCDWIAAVPQLDEQCCALYFDGVSGAGKGLLAAGLARLWREGGPTPLENVLGNFNAEMFSCPFILLDEGLPKRAGNVSAEVRKIIGTLTHSYTQKFVVNRTVNGAVRLLIAANNDNVLNFGDENLTANDLEAIVGRFLRIGARRESKEWLEANNADGLLTKSWVNDDLIAKHCIWLALNRQIKRGKRFLVEGVAVDDMHRKLIMQGETAGLIYEWLARFASNPQALYRSYQTKKQAPLAVIGNQEILINAQGLIDSWPIYMGLDNRCPSTTKVGQTLNKLADGTRKRGRRLTRTTYHKIRLDLIAGWAEDNQIGNVDQMRAHYDAAMVLDDLADAPALAVVP